MEQVEELKTGAEVLLYHGCSAANLQNITSSGLNRAFAGTNGRHEHSRSRQFLCHNTCRVSLLRITLDQFCNYYFEISRQLLKQRCSHVYEVLTTSLWYMRAGRGQFSLAVLSLHRGGAIGVEILKTHFCCAEILNP